MKSLAWQYTTTTSSLLRSTPTGGAGNLLQTSCLAPSTAGIFPLWKLSPITSRSLLQCNAISTAYKEEDTGGTQNLLPTESILEDGTSDKDTYNWEMTSEKISELVMRIQWMLQNMDDGEINVSAYDTAWVALVEDIGGSGEPQFPSTLDWISNNQLSDGSWGDRDTFLIYDRMLNTLACVVALKAWNLHPDKCDQGVSFMRENMYKLDEETHEEYMPNGFEVVFPSLIEKAKTQNIDIPDDSPGLKKIYAKRELKLARIPMEIVHSMPTTLLFSLEGIRERLDWEKLLKLQSTDGSFLYSPSSTAVALQDTKDQKCHSYLLKLVHKFNGGVPNVYPVELFERHWVVDRLQRLGISRYFKPEIDECLHYTYRYWSNYKGTYSTRDSQIQDIDDSAMAFRLLRLHGYDVSPEYVKQFEKDGEFFCFAGQSSQSVTALYNLYRASQVMFPQEKLLADANKFSTNFLQEKRANSKLIDKWIITKDLGGEVGYALDVPWYASLPRLEARFFIQQYGGEDDVWIGKTLYRMGYVNNNTYLELAKLDFNNCQALHQLEWKSIQQWYKKNNLEEFGLSKKSLVLCYYLAAASVFEPEKSRRRLAWTKTMILVKTIASQQLSREQKHDFIMEFEHGSILKNANGEGYKTRSSLVKSLIRTVNKLSLDTLLTQDRDVHQQLYQAWGKWLETWIEEGDGDAELFVSTLNLCHGSDESHPKYKKLLEVTNRVCYQLRLLQNTKEQVSEWDEGTTNEIESIMQELAKLVLTKSSDDLDYETKQNFLTIARSFYYMVQCDPGRIHSHISKVLFERVI